MKFESIFTSYVQENNLNVPVHASQQFNEAFLTEAKRAKAELYKDLAVSSEAKDVTEQDVANIKFYEKGKNIKQGLEGEALSKINKIQADLYNKIIAKVKADAKEGKTTLVELSAATVKICRDAGQNSPTANYNLRGVIEILIKRSNILSPAGGGEVNADDITVAPAEEEDTTETTNDVSVDKSKEDSSSKFDAAISSNEPSVSAENNSYFKVEKGARVEKGEMSDRSDRIACNYLIDTVREELPGFYNLSALISKATEEDAGLSAEEIARYIKHLTKIGKIKMVPKSTSEDAVPDAEDEDSVRSDEYKTEDPEQMTDRLYSGSTRKGFNFDAFDN